MRILQLSKYYPPTKGGLELVAEFFSRAFIDLGHEVFVTSLGHENRIYEGLFGEKVYQGRQEVKIQSTPFSFGYFRYLSKLLKSVRPDLVVVHLPNPFAHEVLKFLRKFSSVKFKVAGIYHSDIINQKYLRDMYNLHFLKDEELYDTLICSSPQLRDLSPILSHLKEKVEVIPFCTERLEAVKPRGEERPFLGSFVAIGRLVPYKGFDFLIDAFNDLPFKLTIIGKGPEEETLRRSARSNTTFAGEVTDEEKIRLLKESDGLIMSSINRSEAFGMTIVEAFSYGVPVIGAAIDSGVSYLLRHQETALTFPVKDKEALKEHLQRFATSPKLRASLSRAGLEFYEKRLSYPAFRYSVEDVLEKLFGDPLQRLSVKKDFGSSRRIVEDGPVPRP